MKENLNDLRLFLLVAQTGSFTKAAAQLGVTQAAVSYAIRALEERLKIKLLERTTRSVSPTPAGEQLRSQIAPLFAQIDAKIADLDNFRDGLSGRLRITGIAHAFHYTLKDKFLNFMTQYPNVEVELVADNRFVDIVAERFDAGIRLGADLAKDMIALRIAPDVQMVTVASPKYWAKHGMPKSPPDLAAHNCLALRLPTHSDLLSWEFSNPKTLQTVRQQPQGSLVAADNQILFETAKADVGVLWIPLDMAAKELANGELVEVLPKWRMKYEGYHLYYPSKRRDSPVFQALIDCLKV